MTTTTEPQEAPEVEKLSDFWQRIHDDGADMRHVHQMINRVTMERAASIAKAARLFYWNDGCCSSGDKPISRADFSDELGRMRSRAYAVFMAIQGSELDRGHERDGLLRLAQDVADGLERLESAFEAERRLEINPEA